MVWIFCYLAIWKQYNVIALGKIHSKSFILSSIIYFSERNNKLKYFFNETINKNENNCQTFIIIIKIIGNKTHKEIFIIQ